MQFQNPCLSISQCLYGNDESVGVGAAKSFFAKM